MFSKNNFLTSLALSASGYLLLMPIAQAQTVMLTGSAVANSIQTNASSLAKPAPAAPLTSSTAIRPAATPLSGTTSRLARPSLTAGGATVTPARTAATSIYRQQSGRQQPYYLTTPSPPRTATVQDNRTFFQKHPMAKTATIGAGVGAGVGAATGLLTGRGVLHGAVAGGATGAGVGVIRSSQIMKRHPIARDVATGAASGLGLGWAGAWDPATKYRTAAVGAALGLGVGLWKHLN